MHGFVEVERDGAGLAVEIDLVVLGPPLSVDDGLDGAGGWS